MKEFFRVVWDLVVITCGIVLFLGLIVMLVTFGIACCSLGLSVIAYSMPVLIKIFLCAVLFSSTIISIGGPVFIIFDTIFGN